MPLWVPTVPSFIIREQIKATPSLIGSQPWKSHWWTSFKMVKHPERTLNWLRRRVRRWLGRASGHSLRGPRQTCSRLPYFKVLLTRSLSGLDSVEELCRNFRFLTPPVIYCNDLFLVLWQKYAGSKVQQQVSCNWVGINTFTLRSLRHWSTTYPLSPLSSYPSLQGRLSTSIVPFFNCRTHVC